MDVALPGIWTIFMFRWKYGSFMLACRVKGLILGILARLNLRFPLESLFWFVAMPENGDSLETELLTTSVVGNFGRRHEFRDVLQTARHRASRHRVGHVSRCGLIFHRCSFIVFCVRLDWLLKSRTLIFQDMILEHVSFLFYLCSLTSFLCWLDWRALIFQDVIVQVTSHFKPCLCIDFSSRVHWFSKTW